MQRGDIDFVVVGADRIAANGDVANKIGTYTVAMMAHAHGVPFYVAAPLSTIDLETADGAAIPIEQRNAREMTHLGSTRIAPEGASVWNPASTSRRHRLVAGIITEKGIARPPYPESLRAAVRDEADERILGIETSCDETAAAVVSTTGRSGAALADRLERDRLAGRNPPRVGRRRPGDRVAPARARHLRRRRARAGGRRRRLAGHRRDRGDAGAGPRRVAARRRLVREGRGRGARQADRRRPSSGRAHRIDLSGTRRRFRCPRRSSSSRAATRACISCRSPACIGWSAGRETMRPARRTTRSRGCSASAIRAVRPSTGWRERAATTRWSCRGRGSRTPDRNALPTGSAAPCPPAGAARSRSSVFPVSKTAVVRHSVRSAACRSRPGCTVPTDAGPLDAVRRSPISARVSSASWSSRSSIARSRRRGWLGARSIGIAGGVSANSRLRRDAAARGEREGVPVFIPSLALSTDNAAMIAAAGLRRLERGETSPLDFNAMATMAISGQRPMSVHTDYLWFETKERQEFVRITDEVAEIVAESGVREGMVLVSAMHITAARLRERLGGRAHRRLPGVAREAGAGGPAVPSSPDRRRQRRRAPQAHDHGASGDACRSPRASSTSDRGSRSSTPSSTASGASAWS